MPENVNVFPEELRRALTSLADETRQTIVSALLSQTECAYTEILEKLNISKGNLNHHLSELMKAGIIMNYSKGKLGSPYESFYALADFGRDFISGIFSALKPPEAATRSQPAWQIAPVGTAIRLGEPVQSAVAEERASSVQQIAVSTPAPIMQRRR